MLHEYVDGSIDSALRAALDRHFAGCRDCHAFLRTYEETVGLTGELPEDEIPDAVRERVHAALRNRLGKDRS